MKKTLIVLLAVVAVLSIPVAAFSASTSSPRVSIFIVPDNGFDTDIIAGLQKKDVPVTIVTDAAQADYTLTANDVTIHQESGAGKIARCLFAYCAGIADSGNVSVQLVDNHSKAIVWGYNVTKQRGSGNRQSMAEAIAKHLNSDFLKKQK
jgi:hypothetical protein